MTSERTCHFTGDAAWKCGTTCTCQHFNWNNSCRFDGSAAMTSEAKRASLAASPFQQVASETQDPRFTTSPCYQQASRQSTYGDSHDQ